MTEILNETNVVGDTSDKIQFSRIDFWGAIVAGFFIALLSLPVLKNIGFFELSILKDNVLLPLFLVLWVIFVPVATVSGLYFTYRLSIFKWPMLFKIGKYGIIGWLNTFLGAGIFNLLIIFTGIATGFIVDIFFVIAFAITITHSFFWNKFWTFMAHDSNNGKAEYVKFFTVTGITSVLNIFLLHIIVNTIGAPNGIDPKLWVNIAFVMLIPVAFFGNFFGYKIFVFKNYHVS